MTRLYTRIYVHLLGMLALVGVVTATVFTTGFRQAYLRGFTERLVRHGASLVADHLLDETARARTVRRLSSELEVDITVRDATGRALEVTGRELPALEPADAKQVLGGAATVEHFQHGWYAAAPIVDGEGRVLGTIQATPVRHMRPPSLWRPVATVMLVLLIVAASAAPLARRISRPIERLTEATRRFGAGDLSSRVKVDHRRRHGRERDELSRLTSAWNDMAERVERLVRGQKELLANVSHELRSPLARIRVALELLPHDAESEGRLRDVEEDLAELDHLIDDTLTASRLEAGGLPAHFQRVEIRPLLVHLVERAALDPQLAGKVVRLDDEGAAPVTALVDAALLKRALWNLVENAGKYGASPIAVSARIEPAASGQRLALSVSDEGPGIPAADRAHVLEPFYRADRARTPSAKGAPSRGFGLGLTIAHHIAQLHEGSLVVEAAHVGAAGESGCRITLSLPLR